MPDKWAAANKPIPTTQRTLGSGSVILNTYRYPVFVALRPSTVTIYNVSTSGVGWTAIASGLSNVLAWRINEKSGNEFRYAYVAAPSTYMTSLGQSVMEDTAITAIYVQRTGATDVDMELEIWTA